MLATCSGAPTAPPRSEASCAAGAEGPIFHVLAGCFLPPAAGVWAEAASLWSFALFHPALKDNAELFYIIYSQ